MTIELQIIIADNATITERLIANDFKLDLQKVSNLEVIVVSEKETKEGVGKIFIETASCI